MAMSASKVKTKAIPQRLKDQPNWVAWRFEERGGSKTKVLYQTNGQRAKSNDPATWTTFDEALETFTQSDGRYAGIGFVIEPPFFGIDLDSCLYPNGTTTTWADNVLEHCPSYAEVSPSGVGLKIIGIGELPMPDKHLSGKPRCGKNFAGDKYNLEPACHGKKSEILIYRRKFFTITGQVFGGLSEVTECPRVAELFTSLVESRPSTTTTTAPSQVSGDDATGRMRAAMAAMNKVSIPATEDDGSQRLLSYARQAKRFILDEGDAIRAVRSMLGCFPAPKQWSDDEILQRYNEADVVAGEGYTEPSILGVDLTNLTCGGASVDVQPVTPPVTRLLSMSPEDEAYLYSVPGFIDEVAQLTLQTAPYPNRALAFCGGLSLLGVLAGRKVCFQGSMTNVNVLALAPSGSGKDAPRKTNIELLAQAGLGSILGDGFASGEGLEDSLYTSPSMLFQSDEFDGIIEAIATGRESRHASIASMLLKFYTSASTYYFLRRKAGGEAPRSIHMPSLNLLATCTPGGFYGAISSRLLSNGLIARMIVVEAGRRGTGQRPQPIEPDPSIMQQIEFWKDYQSGAGNLESVHPAPTEVQIDERAAVALDEFRAACDEQYDAQDDDGAKAIVARCYEQASKLALLYACSQNPSNLLIRSEAVAWSTFFVRRQVERLLGSVESRVHDNDFDRLCGRLLQRLAESPEGVDHSALLKFSRVSSKDFQAAINTLAERGQVRGKKVETAGRPRVLYELIG